MNISPEMEKATSAEMSFDPFVSRIMRIERDVEEYQHKIDFLNLELEDIQEKRPVVSIKWRDSIKWCLEIDSGNWRYFLKTTAGVYKCIAYKNRIELTPDIKNKIAITLSLLYKDKVIGRIMYNGSYLYGLPKFFNDDLTELKEEYKSGLDKLIL